MLREAVLEIVHELGALGFEDIAAGLGESDFTDRRHLVVALVVGDAGRYERVLTVSEDDLADGDSDLGARIISDLVGDDIDPCALRRRRDLVVAHVPGNSECRCRERAQQDGARGKERDKTRTPRQKPGGRQLSP
jgi:hypothetical protein